MSLESLRTLVPHGARIALGLVFFVFGLNGFLNFMAQPPVPEQAGVYLGGLASAGYFFPLLKGTEVIAGVLLLSNRFVPLALVVLAPIVLHIALFHLILAPFLPMVVLLLGLELYLAWVYRDAWRPLLTARHSVEHREHDLVVHTKPASV